MENVTANQFYYTSLSGSLLILKERCAKVTWQGLQLITFKVLLHIIKKRISITAEKLMSEGTMMREFACIELWGMTWNLTKA